VIELDARERERGRVIWGGDSVRWEIRDREEGR